MTFEQLNLNTQITKALTICGYKKPTPIQAQSIPPILFGKDIVASAQTGTGKTAAFVLPALHQLAENQKTGNAPRVLILTPTRELATQITEAVGKYGKFLRCNIVSLVGGMPYRQQLRLLSRPVDIVVATPGRLMDHMSNGRLDLSDIKMLILDEADRMLDMGFIDDVKSIASVTPKNRQTLLFSATVDGRLTQIIRQFLKDPIRIEIESEKLAPAKITQELYMADNPQHKMQLFKHLVKESSIFKAIIFSGTKINADKLADELYEEGYAAAALHGDLRQNVRTRTLDQLRRGKIQFLVATDVAARGIDIQDITHVINFDLPKFSEDYVHRIGRTGRAGKDGIAISFALPSDARHVQRIERLLKQTLDRKVVPGLEPKKQSSSNRPSHGKPERRKKFGEKTPNRFSNGKPQQKKKLGEKTASRFSNEKPREKKKFTGTPSETRRPNKTDRKMTTGAESKKSYSSSRSLHGKPQHKKKVGFDRDFDRSQPREGRNHGTQGSKFARKTSTAGKPKKATGDRDRFKR